MAATSTLSPQLMALIQQYLSKQGQGGTPTAPSTPAQSSASSLSPGTMSSLSGLQGLGGASGGKIGGALSGGASGAEAGSIAGPWGAAAGELIAALLGFLGGKNNSGGAPPSSGSGQLNKGPGIQFNPVSSPNNAAPTVGSPSSPTGLQSGGQGSNPSMQQLIAALMKLKANG